MTKFYQTTGAKIFSSHAGAPTERELPDTEPGLFEIQKQQIAPIPVMQGVRILSSIDTRLM